MGRDDGGHRLPTGTAEASVAAVRGAVAEAQTKLRGVVLRRLGGDRHAAEDVLQRFALRALERAAELRDPGRVHGWLARVLASTLADHGRRLARGRGCPGDPRDIAAAAVAPEPGTAVWACDSVQPLLDAMRPDQAALIRRLDLAGEPRERVAAELGVLRNALHVRHHRARRALAARLLNACVTCPAESFACCACPKPPAVHAARRTRTNQWAASAEDSAAHAPGPQARGPGRVRLADCRSR